MDNTDMENTEMNNTELKNSEINSREMEITDGDWSGIVGLCSVKGDYSVSTFCKERVMVGEWNC